MKTNILQQFLNIHRQITQEREAVKARLRSINEALGDFNTMEAPPSAARSLQSTEARRGGKRIMSPEARARIAAAQKARWAAKRSTDSKAMSAPAGTGPFGRPKRRMSAEGRKAIAEAARKRWAEAKRGGKNSL
jgi:hypothetical protein